ncbi:hypothetical protein Q9L58_010885, partial [Maublancomyces gigas]
MVEWQKKYDKWQLRETKQAVKSIVLSQFSQWSKRTRLRSQRKPQGRPDLNEEGMDQEDMDQENTDIDDREVEERGRPFRWRCPWELQAGDDRDGEEKADHDNHTNDEDEDEAEQFNDDDTRNLEEALNG